jgi:hypothetical protein
MVRRLISAALLVACTGGYAFADAQRANFILTNGERKSGIVAFHGGDRENLINGDLNLAQDNAKDLTFHFDQVAVIDFTGGRPDANEIAQLGAGHMLVMRDGSTQQGRFVNMIGGDTLLWDNAAGQRQQFAIRDVSRVYLNPASARTIFNGRTTQNTAAVGTAGQTGVPVRVDARQEWTDTGITVNAGDRVVFHASGQIAFGQGAGQTADPNGNPAERRANYPDPTVPVGALIGRVGNSAPFAIGMQTQPLAMPASGRLMLGVNDNERGDNSGFFTVTVTRQ